MKTVWKVAPIVLLVTLTACTTHRVTRETIREQPIVQQQPVIERERTIVEQQPVIQRERTVVVVPPASD
jgi:lipoprotein NlpI